MYQLEQMRGFVACGLELVPLRDVGVKPAMGSMTSPSGRRGAWEAHFTQLITHQHHSSVWVNWILCPGVSTGKSDPNVLRSGLRFKTSIWTKMLAATVTSCFPRFSEGIIGVQVKVNRLAFTESS